MIINKIFIKNNFMMFMITKGKFLLLTFFNKKVKKTGSFCRLLTLLILANCSFLILAGSYTFLIKIDFSEISFFSIKRTLKIKKNFTYFLFLFRLNHFFISKKFLIFQHPLKVPYFLAQSHNYCVIIYIKY